MLAKTGEESWAERDLEGWRDSGRAEYDELDVMGPVGIAVAGSVRARDPPAAHNVHGNDDADAEPVPKDVSLSSAIPISRSNEYLDALRNKDLFVNSVNWLAGDRSQITVRPNVSRASSFQMSQEEFRRDPISVALCIA